MEAITKNRTMFMLGAALLFLLLLVLYVYLVVPTNHTLDSGKSTLLQLNSQEQLLQKKLLQKQQEGSDLSQDNIQAALPLWDDTEQLLLDVNTIGSETDCKLLTANFSTVDQVQIATQSAAASGTNAGSSGSVTVSGLKIAADLQGTYGDLIQWMTKLQALPRLIEINTYTLEKSAKSNSDSDIIRMNVSFTAYFDSSYKAAVDHVLQPFSN